MHTQSQRGTVFIASLIVVLVVIGVTASFTFISLERFKASRRAIAYHRTMFLTEAGVSHALRDLNDGGSGNIGSASEPVDYGNGRYFVVTMDNGDGTHTINATGTFGGLVKTLEVVVRRAQAALFTQALFGEEYVLLDSNAFSDSYDSRLGSYASQATNRYRGQSYANDKGDVGSNGDITLDANAKIFGNATPGPGDSVILNSANIHVSGSTASAPADRALDPVVLPEGYSGWGSGTASVTDNRGRPLPDESLAAVTTLSTSNNYTLPAGSYYYRRFVLDSNTVFQINGPSVLVFDHFEANSNVEIRVDASAGPVAFFGTGTFIVDSNVQINSVTRKAADLAIQLATDNIADPSKEVRFDANTQTYATIYAPSADFTMNANIDIYGAVIARRIRVNSNGRFHYDESLGDQRAASGDYAVLTWRVATPDRSILTGGA